MFKYLQKEINEIKLILNIDINKNNVLSITEKTTIIIPSISKNNLFKSFSDYIILKKNNNIELKI